LLCAQPTMHPLMPPSAYAAALRADPVPWLYADMGRL